MVNLLWIVVYFLLFGLYNVDYIFREKKNIFSIRDSGLIYGGNM